MKSPTELQSFKDFAPIVVEVITKLDAVQTKHQDLIHQTRQSAMNILTYLAEGYNKYHAIEKMSLYSKARSEASKLQAYCYLLEKCNILNLQTESLTTNLIPLNGLIKSMEAKT